MVVYGYSLAFGEGNHFFGPMPMGRVEEYRVDGGNGYDLSVYSCRVFGDLSPVLPSG